MNIQEENNEVRRKYNYGNSRQNQQKTNVVTELKWLALYNSHKHAYKF